MKKENREALNKKVTAHITRSLKQPKRTPSEKEIKALLNKARKDNEKK